MSGRKARRITLHGRPIALSKLDGRTKEAMLIRNVRAELMAHCAGNPSATQRLLIERACILSLRVAQIDAKILDGEELTLHDNNYALAWMNGLRRTLMALGVEAREAERVDPMAELHRVLEASRRSRLDDELVA